MYVCITLNLTTYNVRKQSSLNFSKGDYIHGHLLSEINWETLLGNMSTDES